MNDLMKIAEYLDNASVLINRIGKTVKTKWEKSGWFSAILSGNLEASTLENILTKKDVLGQGKKWQQQVKDEKQ